MANLHNTISLSDDFRRDLDWWLAFPTPWNGRSFFLSPRWTPSPDLEPYTDSSGSIGYGAYCQGQWFNGRWDPDHSIQWKELYPIVLSGHVWGPKWHTLCIQLYCYNQAVSHCIASGTSHCPHIMHLLSCTTFTSQPGTYLLQISQLLTPFLASSCRSSGPWPHWPPPLQTPTPTSLPLQQI